MWFVFCFVRVACSYLYWKLFVILMLCRPFMYYYYIYYFPLLLIIHLLRMYHLQLSLLAEQNVCELQGSFIKEGCGRKSSSWTCSCCFWFQIHASWKRGYNSKFSLVQGGCFLVCIITVLLFSLLLWVLWGSLLTISNTMSTDVGDAFK